MYAGLSSVLGLSIAVEARYLVPLTGASLAVAVCGLGLRARRARSYGPFLLGALTAASVMVGKFVLEDPALTYTSLFGLVSAALWSTRRAVGTRPALRSRLRTAP